MQHTSMRDLCAAAAIALVAGAWTPALAIRAQTPLMVVAVSLAAGCLGAAGANFIVSTSVDGGDELSATGRLRLLVPGMTAAAASLVRLPVQLPWDSVGGSAVLIGACVEAGLLAIRWKGWAHAAEQERERANARLQTATRTFIEQIEGLRQAVLGAYIADAPEVDDSNDIAEWHRSQFEARVNGLFLLARRATTVAGDPPSLWDQVRTILARRLGRANVDEIVLADVGGANASVRRQIARDIAKQWSNLNPAWTDDDVLPDSTLASLVNEIDGRTP